MRISDWSSDVCSSDLWRKGRKNRLSSLNGNSDPPQFVCLSASHAIWLRTLTRDVETIPAPISCSEQCAKTDAAAFRHLIGETDAYHRAASPDDDRSSDRPPRDHESDRKRAVWGKRGAE